MSMNWDNILDQANKLKENMNQVKQMLDSRTAEVKGGNGSIAVTISGSGKIKNIRLSADAYSLLGRDGLEKALTSTVNEAYDRSRELAAKVMSDLTGFNFDNFSSMF